MTKEEAKRFEAELLDGIEKMTATIHDQPRYQLTGEPIPPEVLNAEGQNEKDRLRPEAE